MRKIKIDSGLYIKACRRASELKYESVGEYITHLLERDFETAVDSKPNNTVKNRLKGLGYF